MRGGDGLMNCTHVQGLLPLYISRDLEEKRARLVTAHVQSCAECARVAEEYRETRQLLQLFEPPPFGEAAYREIRSRVLREVGRESAGPTLPRLAASLVRPRVRWAAAALLLAVSVAAFYFVANRMYDRRQLAESRRTVNQTTQEQQGPESAASPSPSSDRPPLAGTGGNAGADTMSAGSAARTYHPRRRKSSGTAAERARSVAVNTPDVRSMTAEAARADSNLVESNAAPARDPVTSEKTLRVEMQTKDPGIRIIWFSPQRTKQDSLK